MSTAKRYVEADATATALTLLTDKVGGVENRLSQRIDGVEARLRSEIQEMGSTLRTEMQEMGTTLRAEMQDMKRELREEIQASQAATVTQVGQYLQRLEGMIRQLADDQQAFKRQMLKDRP